MGNGKVAQSRSLSFPFSPELKNHKQFSIARQKVLVMLLLFVVILFGSSVYVCVYAYECFRVAKVGDYNLYGQKKNNREKDPVLDDIRVYISCVFDLNGMKYNFQNYIHMYGDTLNTMLHEH